MINKNSLERDWLRQAELCPLNALMKNINYTLIPDRSQPGIRIPAPTVRHREVGDKFTISVPKTKKIRERTSLLEHGM